MTKRAPCGNGGTRIQSVERAVRILELLMTSPEGRSVASVATELGINRTTAGHLTATLMKCGWVARSAEGSKYVVAPRVGALTNSVVQVGGILGAFQRYGEELTRETRETTHLAVLSGDKVIHVGVVTDKTQLGVSTRQGTVAEAYCTALGKVLVAGRGDEHINEYVDNVEPHRLTKNTIVERDRLKEELLAVRAQGYAFDEEESSVGVRCIAVPVPFRGGAEQFAVSVTGPSSRFTRTKAQRLVPRLSQLAQALSGTLR